jgi:hypothetical protein
MNLIRRDKMNWIGFIATLIGFGLLILIIYNLLRIFVLSKLNVNKWIVLAAAVLVFFLPALTGINMNTTIAALIQSGLFVILFLWFMDLSGFNNRRSKKKEVVIKPKAKPNRIKKNN